MKRALLAIACIAPFLLGPVGCPGQHPVTPPTYTCPPAGSYADLNGATGSASTSYTATNVTGQTCFEAQGYLNGQYGTPSNIVGPTLGGATNKVALSVTCTAGTGQTCSGVQWVFQSAPAVVATAPGTGTVGPPTTSQVVKPAPTTAANLPQVNLKAAGL